MDATTVIRLIEILIAGGIGMGFKNVWDFFVKKSEHSTPHFQATSQVELTEKALVSVSASRDALEQDVARLRDARDREVKNGQEREAWWLAREQQWHDRLEELEAEVDRLRTSLSGTLHELDRVRAEIRHERESREPRD